MRRAEVSCKKHVIFGLLLSASILADDPKYMQELRTGYPDALGYEMEATSIMNVKTSWLIAKAISDWGEGKDNNYQFKAATYSYQFIFNTLEHHIINV